MRQNSTLRKLVFIAAIVLSMLFHTTQAYANANIPYDTYNYDYRDYIVHSPAAYVPEGNISGLTLSVGSFDNPQDLCIAEDGIIYVADTNNNRIVSFDQKLQQVRVIKSFQNNGVEDTLKQPFGVAISESNQIYIADTENKRIVVLEQDGSLVRILENPTSEVLGANFVFTPLKITVDYADRVYCVARGVFEGIMVFEDNGQFTGYFGTINVKITLWEKFWRKIASKEQRSKQMLFTPTEFTGIDIDEYGFIYASNIDSEGVQAIRRLNPRGEDVIKLGEKVNLGGDLAISGDSVYSGPSSIVDVVYRDNGVYSLLDIRRGRVFTYDSEGNLLYIFGGLGSQTGTFAKPVAIEAMGNKILVLDATRKEILTFVATEYGSLIDSAVALRYGGDEKMAVEMWRKVLKLDENFELANVGIGKAYLTAGDNLKAMNYLKLGMSREYYSIAFKRYRNEVLKKNIGYVMTSLVIIIGIYTIVKNVRKKQKRSKGVETE